MLIVTAAASPRPSQWTRGRYSLWCGVENFHRISKPKPAPASCPRDLSQHTFARQAVTDEDHSAVNSGNTGATVGNCGYGQRNRLRWQLI